MELGEVSDYDSVQPNQKCNAEPNSISDTDMIGIFPSWTRKSSDSDVKCKDLQSKRSLKWIPTSDLEFTGWNLDRLTKKIFEFYQESIKNLGKYIKFWTACTGCQ